MAIEDNEITLKKRSHFWLKLSVSILLTLAPIIFTVTKSTDLDDILGTVNQGSMILKNSFLTSRIFEVWPKAPLVFVWGFLAISMYLIILSLEAIYGDLANFLGESYLNFKAEKGIKLNISRAKRLALHGFVVAYYAVFLVLIYFIGFYVAEILRSISVDTLRLFVKLNLLVILVSYIPVLLLWYVLLSLFMSGLQKIISKLFETREREEHNPEMLKI